MLSITAVFIVTNTKDIQVKKWVSAQFKVHVYALDSDSLGKLCIHFKKCGTS